MTAPFDQVDLNDPVAVRRSLLDGAEANRAAACRRGSLDVITPRGPSARLIATGDLHDNPLHLARIVHAAGLDSPPSIPRSPDPSIPSPSHLTLHEVIHGGRLINGMDFSFRALVRVAALKAALPELVHTLLANHELSQIAGAGIVKDGVNVVAAFNDAIDFTFGDEAAQVHAAVAEFIRSMPLALRFEPAPDADTGAPAILCAHSLPGPDLIDRFHPAILERDLCDDDYIPRRGSAHLMVWGRGHSLDLLHQLAARWNVSLFILGHEHAPDGVLALDPNAIILNTDHERAAYLPIDLTAPPPTPAHAKRLARLLSSDPS